MDLNAQLMADLKVAMKAKDKTSLNVIRMIKSSLMNKKIEVGELTEADELAVLTTELKQREDSLTEFEKANRTDLATEIKAEIKVVKTYLPEPLSEADLSVIVDDVIKSVNATSMKDMGSVMPAIMVKVTGRANGNQVSKLVREKLAH